MLKETWKESILEIAKFLYGEAIEKGTISEKTEMVDVLVHFHSEITEVYEALRMGDLPSKKLENVSSVEEELADVFIMTLEMIEFYLEHNTERFLDALEKKLLYNRERTIKNPLVRRNKIL